MQMTFNEVKKYVSDLMPEQKDTILIGIFSDLIREGVVDTPEDLIRYLEEDCSKSGQWLEKLQNGDFEG